MTPVPGESIELTRRLFEAIRAGRAEDAIALTSADFEWAPTAWSGSGIYRGHEELRAWFAQFGPNLEKLRIEEGEISPAGASALVPGTVFDERGAGFATRIVWIFTAQQGKLVAGEAFESEAEARAATGLPAKGAD